jgi:NTE family protein
MGANYMIGVKVAIPLVPAEELNTAFDVLYQIGFYKDADDYPKEAKLCNILVEPPMRGFNAASFADADTIIKVGQEWGRKYYPQFKALADSLKKADPNYKFRTNRLPDVKAITVDEIAVDGLKITSNKSFLHMLGVAEGDTTNGVEIGHGVRRIFGSRNYNRINYKWEPTTTGHAKLKFNVIENPKTFVKVSLHYNSFSKIALITGVESKNLLMDRSKTTIKLNISENYRVLLEQNQSLGKRDNNNVILSCYLESFKYPIYVDFQQKYLYRNTFLQFDLKAQHTFNLRSALGVGTAYETQKLKPKVYGEISVESGNRYFDSYLFYKRNTLDDKQFPTKGMKVEAKAGYIYGQHPDALFIQAADMTANIDTLSFTGYGQFQLALDNYTKLNKKFTLIETLNSGFNFDDKNSYLNFFYVGGLTDFLRNQITFAGLSEYEVYTNSAVTGLLGIQYHATKSVYGTLKANVALYDFLHENPDSWNSENFLSGYSATVGYSSGFGPIQLSMIYSDQSKNLMGYINIGYHF